MMAARAQGPGGWLLDELLVGMTTAAVAPVPVSALALDSRKAAPGSLFLACQGGRAHGLDFARALVGQGVVAIAAEPTERWSKGEIGALAAELGLPVIPVERLAARTGDIAARFHQDPSTALEVIGITGTNGKTSVSHFIAQGLAAEARCAIVGTLGQGFPETLSSTGMTTPDAISLQATLAALRDQGAEAVAMEVSSHALAQQRADAVHFDVGLLTNLTRDHLDYHGSMEAYAAAKARLFALPGLRWAILNADDDFSTRVLATLAPGVKLALYSLNPALSLAPAVQGRCDLLVRARHLELHQRGLRLEVEARRHGEDAELLVGEFSAGLIGRFNAANLLATLTVLLARGMAFETALHQLARVKGVPGRMECFGAEGEPLCVVDYAHTPDALEQALMELRAHCRGQVILVFGCGGERDRGKRPLMGQVAARLADRIILTDDNPRHEDGDVIIAEILSGIGEPGGKTSSAAASDQPRSSRAEVDSAKDGPANQSTSTITERQRGVAIRRALLMAGPEDAVLIAGKGHETEQDMGELKARFSDRAQVMQALREWRGRDG
ncbi:MULTISPECIES: Mur ligase family protein [Thiorhodovibrio]|uniref:Mur ligase family protein n=1 Tax=Thiorhodovibrio TaxID=61593 RepID=UPI001914994C|nr:MULTISPECIES: UDP-N-acetylmuramoyl-L-alanyl-D-glutamate--2,6-diaminopimelate ligase [Thiorhodovibrio]MBK5968235.1 UDP-N-acetylmuramoyl-L-alanyl-D-glutamate--2,6-diaminopimelate ligase [Thiorhodovibrio winogradskyi]WPL14789.1 UDP-N-acetylmuramoyl-L-alanyl-D-glutamate--2,6-diaminopimelate ligase [Thiorhodovibrio litoralis]